MILEIIENGSKRTYSSEGFIIRQIQTGNLYDEAFDIEEATYTYEETEYKTFEEIDTL